MKTTKKDFEEFKAEFLKWVGIFGLGGYLIYFLHKKLDNSNAQIAICEESCSVDVTLTTDNYERHPNEIKLSAKHEAIHLLTYRLAYLGELRYVRKEEIQDEWEKLVLRLEKVLK